MNEWVLVESIPTNVNYNNTDLTVTWVQVVLKKTLNRLELIARGVEPMAYFEELSYSDYVIPNNYEYRIDIFDSRTGTGKLISSVTFGSFPDSPDDITTYDSHGEYVTLVGGSFRFPYVYHTSFKMYRKSLNNPPILTLNTIGNRTLYENDTFTVDGSTTDKDNGDAVTVKYQINSGTVRNLHSAVFDGTTPIPFSKSLTYKEGVLFDGSTALTSVLAEGTPHVISVWSEDGNGGKSAVENRTFYVVPNRPPSLTIDPIAAQSELINSNVINVSGAVTDADNNDVVVTFAINSEEPQQVYEGQPSRWEFNIALKDLRVGKNTVMIKAVDIYDAETSKVLTINKTHDAVPVNEAIALYKISPPTGSAQKVLLWIERQLGDLSVSAEASMTNEGEPENFVSIERTNSELKGVLQEDEFAYNAHELKTNIIIKIVYNRNDSESQETIKKISGVLA